MTVRRRQGLHVLGPGAVGLHLLERAAAARHAVTAVTDSTGTLLDHGGLDIAQVLAWKRAGRSLCDHPAARTCSAEDAVHAASAAVVADATSSETRAGWSALLSGVLHDGGAIALAAKSALAEAGPAWLNGAHSRHVGCNAALGGTGAALSRELPGLRRRWRAATIVGNASTTCIITALERGAPFTAAVAEATRLGYLEPDPELDLRGSDAAVKLAIVAGLLRGTPVTAPIHCDDIRELDPLLLRARARRGLTTRLVARAGRDGELGVRYEAIPADSILAAPADRVVYEYTLDGGERRLHVGAGLGAARTADALWADVTVLARGRASVAQQPLEVVA